MPDLNETPEQKADKAMAAHNTVLLTYVAGPTGWPYSGLTRAYANYDDWLADARAHNDILDTVAKAGATHPDAIRAVLVAYYTPPPPPPVVIVTEKPPVSPSDIAALNLPPRWFDPYGQLIRAIAEKVGVPL